MNRKNLRIRSKYFEMYIRVVYSLSTSSTSLFACLEHRRFRPNSSYTPVVTDSYSIILLYTTRSPNTAVI